MTFVKTERMLVNALSEQREESSGEENCGLSDFAEADEEDEETSTIMTRKGLRVVETVQTALGGIGYTAVLSMLTLTDTLWLCNDVQQFSTSLGKILYMHLQHLQTDNDFSETRMHIKQLLNFYPLLISSRSTCLHSCEV